MMRQTTSPLAIVILSLASCNGTPSSNPAKVICDPPQDTAHDGPFAPADQSPMVELGLVLPPNSLPCIPVSTGNPQNNCNHHGSTIAELPDGSVGIVWYHGEFEKSLDSRLVWSRRAPGATMFTAPEVLFDEPNLSDGNPALFVGDGGEIDVFFPTIYGTGWDQTHIRMVRSMDGGTSFSAPVTLRDKYCGNARHRPLRMDNGELLLPLYHECLALPMFIRSSDAFATWQAEDPLPLLDHPSQIQPALIAGKDGRVLAITRDGSGKGRIHRMESTDHGHTFTPSIPTTLPNAGTSVDWVRLANGHVVVVFNNSPSDRYPLSVALSVDDGLHFVALRNLDAVCDKPSCSFAYPSIMQSAKDGSIWVSYTHDRETIGWAHLNEAWLAEGTEKPLLKCLVGEECRSNACVRLCSTNDDCAVDMGEVCQGGGCGRPCQTAADCCGDRCEAGICLQALAVTCQ